MPAEVPGPGPGDGPERGTPPSSSAAGEAVAGEAVAHKAVASPTGPDLARAALASAKARAKERGATPRATRARRAVSRPTSGSDERDPMLFGEAIRRLVADRGWEATTSAARVMGEWEQLVGPAVAEHCRPASLLDGELVLVAQSSAWATQLRMMTRVLLARLAAQVGPGVVRGIVVRGPAQPDWRRGPRRVQGRGPRDTYG